MLLRNAATSMDSATVDLPPPVTFDKASPSQREAFSTILLGKAGAVFAILAPLSTNVIGP